MSDADWQELFRIDPAAHLAEADDAEAFFAGFGDRVPAEVHEQLERAAHPDARREGVARPAPDPEGPTTRWRRALLVAVPRVSPNVVPRELFVLVIRDDSSKGTG